LIDYLLHPQWLKDVALGGRPHTFGNLTQYVPKATTPADFAAWVNAQFDPSVTWKDIEWLRSVWDGDLVIKGVLTPEDALCAADAGANAVVVSNHGGRQLDGVPSAIKALPSIVDQAGDRLDVLMDSGIRSGLDIVKAIAYGAKGTLIGRPWIWSVAAHGSDGVSALLGTFKREMAVAMALTSTTRVDQLTREILTDR
jgi:L-lactate dehydrogenase (cytochrome)